MAERGLEAVRGHTLPSQWMRGVTLRGLGAALDFVLPPHCIVCAAEIHPDRKSVEKRVLCDVCARDLRPAANASLPEDVRACHSAYTYGDTARSLVHTLKYGDHLEVARLFAGAMRHVAPDLLAENDLIVSVPLHRARLLRRKYNQSALLAKVLSKGVRAPTFAPEMLLRCRITQPLARLSPAERRASLRDAFVVPRRYVSRLTGLRVLLVDDVLTTGTTASYCARALLAGGARSVDLLTATRA